MCCHPVDMYNPVDGSVTVGPSTVSGEESGTVTPPLVVEPTQEQLDEIADRDEEIAEEDPI